MNRKTEKIKNMKVALVEDFLTRYGGAQLVLKTFHEMWPEAPVYTPTYFPENFDPPLDGWDIRTSFINKLPFSRQLEHQYKLFYTMAIEQFDLSEYDMVISSSVMYAKGVIVPPETPHFCYLHTVPRFLWGYRTSKHETVNPIYKNLILPPLEHYWRVWDRQASERPDVMWVNSKNIARRVKKFYRRDSEVIYPPVIIEDLLNVKEKKGNYFIYFGRLEKYKCVDMAIRACIETQNKLVIVGTGLMEQEYKKLVSDLGAEKSIEFTGWVSDEERNKLIAGANAFIFSGPDEDFGIVMVEALAAGTPVIAFDSGGAQEIVEGGKTGVMVPEFSQEALNSEVKAFNPAEYDPETCREVAKKFSRENFVDNILESIAANI